MGGHRRYAAPEISFALDSRLYLSPPLTLKIIHDRERIVHRRSVEIFERKDEQFPIIAKIRILTRIHTHRTESSIAASSFDKSISM